jgi:hypothetical protein
MSFSAFSVAGGHEIVDGQQVAVEQACGSTFGIVFQDRYDPTVTGARPAAARFIDPEGLSARGRCHATAVGKAVTIGFLLAFAIAIGIIAMVVRPPKRRTMDEIGPLPG